MGNIWGSFSFGTAAIKIPAISLASQHGLCSLVPQPRYPYTRTHIHAYPNKPQLPITTCKPTYKDLRKHVLTHTVCVSVSSKQVHTFKYIHVYKKCQQKRTITLYALKNIKLNIKAIHQRQTHESKEKVSYRDTQQIFSSLKAQHIMLHHTWQPYSM